MPRVFRLLRTGMYLPPVARRRLWMAPGQTLHLASGARVRILVRREGVDLSIVHRGVIDLRPLDLYPRPDLGLIFIPRAVELGARNWPVRFLLEIALSKAAGNTPGHAISKEVTKPCCSEQT